MNLVCHCFWHRKRQMGSVLAWTGSLRKGTEVGFGRPGFRHGHLGSPLATEAVRTRWGSFPAVTASVSDVPRDLGPALGLRVLTRHRGSSRLPCAPRWGEGEHITRGRISTVLIPRRPVLVTVQEGLGSLPATPRLAPDSISKPPALCPRTANPAELPPSTATAKKVCFLISLGLGEETPLHWKGANFRFTPSPGWQDEPGP